MTRAEELLRVALSMLTLVPGGMGGSETYARELTRQLATTDRVDAWAVLPATARGFSAGIRETIIDSVRPGPSTRGRAAGLIASVAAGRRIRRSFATADVVHYPFTVAVPRPTSSQALVHTLHDVQHLDLPDLFSPAERMYRRVLYEGALRRADAVITISQFSKQRIVALLGIAADRVHVAHLGVDPGDFRPNEGSRENFVLYPARGWPHKNHSRLIEAVALLRATDESLRLVLTGGGLDALGAVPSWVERRGHVPSGELKQLYRSASVLAFPSLYEGFGLPPLEAMASGCPTAVSDLGALAEVCGDAAITFDPRDPAAIARGISRARDLAPVLRVKGLANVRRFTWEACRDSHLSAYGAAHERHSRTGVVHR